jgi:hypothetical protein
VSLPERSSATRADRLRGMVKSPIPVFWNIEKK